MFLTLLKLKILDLNKLFYTLQMDFVLGTLNQHRTDRIKVVIVTASERASSCFSYLGNKIYTTELFVSSHGYCTVVFYMKNKLLSPVFLVKRNIKQPGCEQMHYTNFLCLLTQTW